MENVLHLNDIPDFHFQILKFSNSQIELIFKYTGSLNTFTSCTSLIKALRESSPQPGAVMILTGAIQPFNSLSALLAAWIRMPFRKGTSLTRICSPNLGDTLGLSRYLPSGIHERCFMFSSHGSSIVKQINSVPANKHPLVPVA